MKREIPEYEQNKFVRLYDVAKRCLILIDVVYNNIEKNIGLLTNKDSELNTESIIYELYLDAFSFVDFTNRFQQTIKSMTLLSKNEQHVKQLFKTLKPIKDCRNYLQHMKEHLCREKIIDYPIMGAFSWISENKNYLLLPNQFSESNRTIGIAYDRIENKYICKYQFIVEKYEIKIDFAYKEIKYFWNWFESVVHIEPEEIKKYEWGNPKIFYSMFK